MIIKTRVKVDQEALKRNAKRQARGEAAQPRDFEPAIMLGFYDETDSLCSEVKAQRISWNCPTFVIQDDAKKGFLDGEGREARIWIELLGVPAILPPLWHQ